MTIADKTDTMTLADKIERLIVIPQRIAEYEQNRKRFLGAKSPDFGDKPSSGTKSNSTEMKNVEYADYGKRIDELKRERDKLAMEIQQEVDERLSGELENDIELRKVVKASFIDFRTIETIAKSVIYRSKNRASDLFHLGCERLAIPNETMDRVRKWSRRLAQLEKDKENLLSEKE